MSEAFRPTSDFLRVLSARGFLHQCSDLAELDAKAWADYGEVIVCDSYEEMVAEADRIASEHQGRIDVATEPGAGSCFSLHLPLLADRAGATVRAPAA